MRIIKFRVWVFESDIKKGYMLDIYEKFEKDCNSDYYLVYEDFRDLEDGRCKNCIPLQFTGLHDKNGKEIYEGDIFFHHLQGKRKVYYPFSNDSAIYGMENLENGMKSYLVNSHLYELQ